MSAQIDQVKALAAKARAANAWELKPVVLALVAAIIEWMEQHEGSGNGTDDTKGG